MSIFILKITAMITMLIDHIGFGFFDDNSIMRSIGRIAFPCYAFLMAEGFRHIRLSRSRIIFHLKKLIILAVVSEFAYDIFNFTFDFSRYFESQSNLLTLLIAYCGLIAIDKYKNNRLAVVFVCIITSLLTIAFNTNYILVGVLLVYAFYWYLDSVTVSDVSLIPNFNNKEYISYKFTFMQRYLIILLILIVYLCLYFFTLADFKLGSTYLYAVKVLLPRYVVFFIASAMFASYNGTLGYNSKWFRHLYSWFYPVHLLILGIIEVLIAIIN